MSKCPCGGALERWYEKERVAYHPHTPWFGKCVNCGFTWGVKG